MNLHPEVTEAALWLDEHWPTEEIGTEWYRVIDPQMLDMESACLCVAGQLGAAIAENEGYEITRGDNQIRLGAETARVISGWSILTTDAADLHNSIARRRDWQANCRGARLSVLIAQEELRLVELMLKRLETEYIPESLRRAFDENIPNQRWMVEVDKRKFKDMSV